VTGRCEESICSQQRECRNKMSQIAYTKVHPYMIYCLLALLKYVTCGRHTEIEMRCKLYVHLSVVLRILFAAVEGNLELSIAVRTYLLTH
jgi:hypothetical protein